MYNNIVIMHIEQCTDTHQDLATDLILVTGYLQNKPREANDKMVG